MNLLNAVQNIHDAMASAEWNDFSPITYEDRDWEHYSKTKEDKRITKSRRPSEQDIEVMAMFPQTWGSTALGFGGIGGAAICTAYTIVLHCGSEYCVYFGGRFAYRVTKPNATFFLNAQHGSMASVADHAKRYLGERE